MDAEGRIDVGMMHIRAVDVGSEKLLCAYFRVLGGDYVVELDVGAGAVFDGFGPVVDENVLVVGCEPKVDGRLVAIELTVCFDNGPAGDVQFSHWELEIWLKPCDAVVPDPAVARNLSMSAVKESAERRAAEGQRRTRKELNEP